MRSLQGDRAHRSVPTFVGRLRATYRHVLAGVGLIMLVSVGMLGGMLLHTQPTVERFTVMTRDVRLAHEGMLAQNAAVRAFLATGDRSFLDTYHHSGREAGGFDALSDHIDGDRAVIRALIELRVRQERWTAGWAEPAIERGPLPQRSLDRLLDQGARLFNAYDAAYETAVETTSSQRDTALALQRDLLVLGIVVEAVVGLSLVVLARRNHARLRTDVVAPLDDLAATMRRVAEGDLDARPDVHGGPAELVEVTDGFVDMTVALALQQRIAARREAEAVESARRLSELLGLARDIAGSLSERYVAESVTAAALRVGGAERVVLWHLAEGAADLVAVCDTDAPRGQRPDLAPVPLGTTTAGVAARDARTVAAQEHGEWVTALPTVVGAKVTGAIEVIGGVPGSEAVHEALETLAIHAGAALEAARLHHRTEELSQVDALTGLFNRRRFEEDLEAECQRSTRYHRPLGFIMADIDHFKALNDNHGHQYGDEVLQRVAGAIAATVRSSDTVYRYGGEEFAVLVREGDAEAAAGLAERLRSAVAQAIPAPHGFSRVTASFGVAELGPACSEPRSLVAAADEALYAAKRNGRDRVEVGRPQADALTAVS